MLWESLPGKSYQYLAKFVYALPLFADFVDSKLYVGRFTKGPTHCSFHRAL